MFMDIVYKQIYRFVWENDVNMCLCNLSSNRLEFVGQLADVIMWCIFHWTMTVSLRVSKNNLFLFIRIGSFLFNLGQLTLILTKCNLNKKITHEH